jgi:hypothetical protein
MSSGTDIDKGKEAEGTLENGNLAGSSTSISSGYVVGAAQP